VVGMPGYPVAFYTILREFIQPILEWYGFCFPIPDQISAYLTRSIKSSPGLDEYILATAGKVRNKWVATPLSRQSGVQMNLVRSNAYLKIPADQEELKKGSRVNTTLQVQKGIAEQVILITGSHDLAIDYIADIAREKRIIIASSHVGSMDGLLTLKDGNCHLAPMHLLADDNEYNIPFLKQYFPNKDLVLICVAERIQGIVSREVLDFEAITTHRFINRQKGSGTRILLDRLLAEKKIHPEDITGYDQEVSSHYEVCLAVQSGDADIGLTTYGAALTFGLPFIPIGVERYELVTTKDLFEEDSRIRAIVDILNSNEFKQVLTHLGGYEMDLTGMIRECRRKKGSRNSMSNKGCYNTDNPKK
ncbi:MAG TPA: substrate-binding domain-containing protein, partial [Methanospirillum sp.]|uniref:substrate-binding domain-containing protein n=1 Tax=Methanospirillum sp. TaxID=45200 RepID=UPI002B59DB96